MRACLVISLIVLVWNLAVTVRDGLRPKGTAAGAGVAGVGAAPRRTYGSGGDGAAAGATGGTAGTLSVRQRFLLGRRVDVNRAGWREISGLPGISDAVARAVVERRRQGGPFRRAEELLDVPGIKEKRLKKILPFLSEFPNN